MRMRGGILLSFYSSAAAFVNGKCAGFCRDFWAGRKKAPGGVERLKMASACALAIFSGRIIFIFGLAERLRTLR